MHPRDECEWCPRLAVVTVHAQWTLFDFDDALACNEHREAATRRFWNRTVDGQKPVDVWSTEIYIMRRLLVE